MKDVKLMVHAREGRTGDVVTVPDARAKQLVSGGVARYEETKKAASKQTAAKPESKSEGDGS